jgi:hypothetical protein
VNQITRINFDNYSPTNIFIISNTRVFRDMTLKDETSPTAVTSLKIIETVILQE